MFLAHVIAICGVRLIRTRYILNFGWRRRSKFSVPYISITDRWLQPAM